MSSPLHGTLFQTLHRHHGPGAFTNQADTSQTPPTFAPLGNHGQSLPSKPSTSGKQFGQDHTRGKFQKRLSVKHPASAMFFLPHHQRVSPVSRPSAGNVSSLSTARVRTHVLVGLWCANRDLTDVPDAKVNMYLQRLSNVRRLDSSCSGHISSSTTAIQVKPAARQDD